MKAPRAVHASSMLSRHKRLRTATCTAYASQATCRQCMYWLRIYIPLTQLRKHQDQMRTHLHYWANYRRPELVRHCV